MTGYTWVMTETADRTTEQTSAEFGQALASLLRAYGVAARNALDGLPGGSRGYQVMSIAAVDACSNQAAVAEQLGIDRTVMTYLVDDLEKAGLAARRPDPTDRRARQVVLTSKGRKAYDKAAAEIAEVEQRLLGALSDEEQQLFRTLLGRLTVNVPPIDAVNACVGEEEIC